MANFLSKVKIDGVTANIKDASLTTALNTEKTTRANADTTLQGNIDAEAAARAAADAVLQDEIDALSAATAYYAVDTVADMQALTDVKTGAIISTRGYYAVNDGGAGRYYLTNTGTIDNYLSYGVAGKVANLIHSDGEIVINQIGAHGDGETDDTAVINWALQNFIMTKGMPGSEYLISATLFIPYGHSFDGQECTIRTVPMTDFTAHGIAIDSKVSKLAMWLEGREPISGSEHAGYTKEVKNFRLIEANVDAGNNPTNNCGGLYLGYKTPLTGTNSKVNNSVYGYLLSNISIVGFRCGLYLSEAWDTKIDGVKIRDMLSEGIACYGQSVNIYWTNCNVDGRNRINTVGADYNVSPNYGNRPEGHLYTGCAFFSCTYGFRQTSALSIQLSNCMLDLHNVAAITIYVGDMMVTNCWLSSKTGVATYQVSNSAVQLNSVVTASPGNKFTAVNCHIVNRNDNQLAQPGAVMQGYNRYADIISDCMIEGSARQLHSNAALRLINNSLDDEATIYTAGNGVRSGNYRASTGAAVA